MRSDKEIGISAVRGGTIVGEHEVIFAGPDEVIEFKHTAYSKACLLYTSLLKMCIIEKVSFPMRFMLWMFKDILEIKIIHRLSENKWI